MILYFWCCFFFFKQKTAYEMRISDWSSDVCSSDLDKIAQHRSDLHGLWKLRVRGARRRPVVPLAQPLDAGLGGADPMAVAELDHGEAAPGADAEGFGPGRRLGGTPLHQRREVEAARSEEHTSELQSLMRISYAVFCLKKKKKR